MEKKDLPNIIPVFPLSNFIIFPKTTVPLNIFEPRYIQMIDDCMKTNRLIGIIQPKKTGNLKKPDVYTVGCSGKITSFSETNDGRYLIIVQGICRFKTINEIENAKLYREFKVDFNKFENDLNNKSENISFLEIKKILNDLKDFLKKEGFIINWKEIEKQNVKEIINTLSIASPFSLEEKQILLESNNTIQRKNELEKILMTYSSTIQSTTTIQ